jgi:hypothetical protein
LKAERTPFFLSFHASSFLLLSQLSFFNQNLSIWHQRKATMKEESSPKIRGFKANYRKKGETFTKTHHKKALKLFKKIDWEANDGRKSGVKSTKKGLEHQVAQVKLYIDRVNFIKNQADLMAQEIQNSLD